MISKLKKRLHHMQDNQSKNITTLEYEKIFWGNGIFEYQAMNSIDPPEITQNDLRPKGRKSFLNYDVVFS